MMIWHRAAYISCNLPRVLYVNIVFSIFFAYVCDIVLRHVCTQVPKIDFEPSTGMAHASAIRIINPSAVTLNDDTV